MIGGGRAYAHIYTGAYCPPHNTCENLPKPVYLMYMLCMLETYSVKMQAIELQVFVCFSRNLNVHAGYA